MFLKLQLSNQFIRTRHETMKSFTAQGPWWQIVLWWKLSSFSQPSWPERLLTSEALWKGTFIQRMNAGESCSEPLSKWSVTWDNFSYICLEFTAEFQEDFSIETLCHHWSESIISLMNIVFFRGCFLFTFTQVFIFFCIKLHFRKLKDSSEKQLITCQIKSCSDSLLAFKHQNKWCHFQKVSNTGGFSSVSLTFATFCFWVVFWLLLLDISILALQNKCGPTTVFWPWCQRANMGVIYITLCLLQRLLGTSGSFRT